MYEFHFGGLPLAHCGWRYTSRRPRCQLLFSDTLTARLRSCSVRRCPPRRNAPRKMPFRKCRTAFHFHAENALALC
jgi:hypothetical protein